ncbi:MAG: DegT/DnrJ/EryC1/StrS family aminotransferase [Lentisphaerae bacterium]|jgi:perosamine synthetase|nr:DegT/DnrJ/EryC1/StrS family aminotransferase [Lentisphaerota bacterium]MBT5608179.1 DegT/DnrJ/EryC1/StrS family aminotransferase [Lentisphaerota bacterium]MBT7058932.1 DegT/DnrJ/EryC1/StrS family aminotransferase [Lentisphaerota bacterium]MBT7842837.1 DegT/DnrJ/EryC1/StrS family aminotransferase [Lentisphaerota bacterium]
MLNQTEIADALSRGKFDPPWRCEPLLGSTYGEEEVDAAVAAIREAMDVSKGFGFSASPIPEFEQAFADHVGCKHAVAINSAGPGLDIAMRYLNLQPGDEVIVPSANYQAAPLAVFGAGGQVVWGDIDPRTFQLDPADVQAKLTPRTRAIFPVHMNGLSAPMDELIKVGHDNPHPQHGRLPVISDAARSCGGGYKNGKIGKKGLMTVFSFHTMKNMTTLGEGGMITTDDDDVERYCRSVRMYGGGVGAWGTSNVMTKVQAAVGLVQLSKLDQFIDARHRLAEERHKMLEGLPEIILPHEPEDTRHSFYLYTCLVCEEWAGEKRDRLIAMMDEEFGIGCGVANRPVYVSRKILAEHTTGQRTPVAEAIGERLLCVSLHPAMTDHENRTIAAALIRCVERLRH